ncbi:MAG TPA: heavy-metal-associated domain-containing protein [Albitalea sp.]|nr:heavy-metal-associated domain-containing protein [Albitalea sp.]
MIEFTVPTITCGHCVRTVTETVKKVDAQAEVNISLPEHRVQIESQRPSDEFAKALAEEGYAPT